MRVDTLLTDLLRATADKAAAGRRVDLLRDRLDTEARRRYADEGAAPSWKAPALGTVRLDPKPAKAYVADPDAFASYVAERFPGEVTARLELPAGELEAALEALSFAGVTVHRSAVEVRSTFTEALLGNAEVLYDDTDPANVVKVAARVVDGDQLEPIAGADVLPPSATLVVSLDRAAKATTLARVEAELEAEDALEGTPPTAEQEAEAQRIGDRLRAAVAMTGEPVDEAVLADAVDVLTARDPEAALAARLSRVDDPAVVALVEAEQDAAAVDRRTAADAGDAAYAATVAVTPELVAATALDEADDAVSLGAIGGIPIAADPSVEPDTVVLRAEGQPDTVVRLKGADLVEELTAELDAPRSERTGVRLDRLPYVGEGSDGARRSAEVDRSELDAMAADDPRRPQLEDSAAAWDEQAERMAAAEAAHVPAPKLPAGAPPYTARRGMVFAPQPGDPGYALLPPAPSSTTTEPELLPTAAGTTAPEASSDDPGVDVDAHVAAELATELPIAAGDDLTADPPRSAAAPEPVIVDPVTELAKLGTDDLKRAARTHRLPISGTKVVLAAKLHKAGLTPEAVLALRPAPPA